MGASTVAGSGVVRITNSTLTGNTAQGGGAPDLADTYGGSGYGGALFNLDGAVTLNDDTLAGNTVFGASGANAAGGAVYSLAFGNVIQTGAATSATLVFNNNILSNTAGGTDLAADAIDGNGTNTAAITGSSNLVMTTNLSHTSLAAGVITVVADPQLDPLQQTDGLTPTMRLPPSSPAYGAGNPHVPGLPTTDQRGLARVVNGRLDLGAFEIQNATLTGLTGLPDTVNGQPGVPPNASPFGVFTFRVKRGKHWYLLIWNSDPADFFVGQMMLQGLSKQQARALHLPNASTPLPLSLPPDVVYQVALPFTPSESLRGLAF
jgi:hypothetical protein